MMTRQRHVWVVDGIAEEVARVEVDGERVVTIPAWVLPADVREGDVLRVSHQREQHRSVMMIERDPLATRRATERSERQLARMPPTPGPGGDIVL